MLKLDIGFLFVDIYVPTNVDYVQVKGLEE
jgi:hypothetical protein